MAREQAEVEIVIDTDEAREALADLAEQIEGVADGLDGIHSPASSASRGMSQVQREMARAATASQTVSVSSTQTAAALTGVTSRAQPLNQAVSSLSSSLSLVNPAMSGLGLGARAAIGPLTNLSGALAAFGGPVGIAITGLTALAGVYALWASRAKEAAEANEGLTSVLSELIASSQQAQDGMFRVADGYLTASDKLSLYRRELQQAVDAANDLVGAQQGLISSSSRLQGLDYGDAGAMEETRAALVRERNRTQSSVDTYQALVSARDIPAFREPLERHEARLDELNREINLLDTTTRRATDIAEAESRLFTEAIQEQSALTSEGYRIVGTLGSDIATAVAGTDMAGYVNDLLNAETITSDQLQELINIMRDRETAAITSQDLGGYERASAVLERLEGASTGLQRQMDTRAREEQQNAARAAQEAARRASAEHDLRMHQIGLLTTPQDRLKHTLDLLGDEALSTTSSAEELSAAFDSLTSQILAARVGGADTAGLERQRALVREALESRSAVDERTIQKAMDVKDREARDFAQALLQEMRDGQFVAASTRLDAEQVRSAYGAMSQEQLMGMADSVDPTLQQRVVDLEAQILQHRRDLLEAQREGNEAEMERLQLLIEQADAQRELAEAQLAPIEAQQAHQMQMLEQTQMMWNSMMQQGLQASLAISASTLGNALAGVETSYEEFLGQMLSSYGSTLLTMGTGLMWVPGMQAQATGMIAGGTAMLTLGAAFGATGSKGGSTGGQTSRPQGSTSSESRHITERTVTNFYGTDLQTTREVERRAGSMARNAERRN